MLPNPRFFLAAMIATLLIGAVSLLGITLVGAPAPVSRAAATGPGIVLADDNPEWKQLVIRAALRRGQELERLRELPEPQPPAAPADDAVRPAEAMLSEPLPLAMPATPDAPTPSIAADGDSAMMTEDTPADVAVQTAPAAEAVTPSSQEADRSDIPTSAIASDTASDPQPADTALDAPTATAAFIADPGPYSALRVSVPLPPSRPHIVPAAPGSRATRKPRARVAAAEQTPAQTAPADPLGQLLNSLLQGAQTTPAPATRPGLR
jgi:hypothetical protein